MVSEQVSQHSEMACLTLRTEPRWPCLQEGPFPGMVSTSLSQKSSRWELQNLCVETQLEQM